MSERLGVLGGAFDPIHIGHLILASEAKRQLDLHRVLFIPTYQSAHQDKIIATTFEHRCAMTRVAVVGQADFTVSDIESRVSGKSFTVATLSLLKDIYRDSSLFFIMGTDSLQQFDTWHEPDKVLKLATVVVAHRPGHEPELRGKSIRLIEMPLIDISASEIRRRVHDGIPIRFMVPETVAEYITRSGLYRKNDG